LCSSDNGIIVLVQYYQIQRKRGKIILDLALQVGGNAITGNPP